MEKPSSAALLNSRQSMWWIKERHVVQGISQVTNLQINYLTGWNNWPFLTSCYRNCYNITTLAQGGSFMVENISLESSPIIWDIYCYFKPFSVVIHQHAVCCSYLVTLYGSFLSFLCCLCKKRNRKAVDFETETLSKGPKCSFISAIKQRLGNFLRLWNSWWGTPFLKYKGSYIYH